MAKENKSKRPAIPVKITNVLWARAAGRCEFEGCNELLCEDWLTGKIVNGSQVAHILPVANSARAKNGQTEDQKTDINNLMLICYKHHNLIDKSAPEEYPEERLLEMKRKHEDRIKRATAVQANKQTLVLLYGANIGDDTPLLNYRLAQEAISPDYYVSENSPITIQIKGSMAERDHYFWEVEKENIQRELDKRVLPFLGDKEIEHISVFALAPQPLLVFLGKILNEKYPIRTFQKHRIPDTWNWQKREFEWNDNVECPKDFSKQPVVIFAVSGGDIIKRTIEYYKNQATIWIYTLDSPDMNVLQSEEQLFLFRDHVRRLLEDITSKTSFDTIHVHMALPNACAIELGRVWMPKVHKKLLLFESTKEDIVETFKID